jgi:hypothetical protein
VLYEHFQIIEDRKTQGNWFYNSENDKKLIHLELYKFYLFDPVYSSESINNWIGPNRNDSSKKIKKSKQLSTILYGVKFNAIDIDTVSQLCLLVSLFIPMNLKQVSPVYEGH